MESARAEPVRTCEEAAKGDGSWLVLASPETRSALEAAVHQGIAVVRFDGCELEVVHGCTGLGVYTDGPPSDEPRDITISDLHDLFRDAPVDAPSIASELEHGASLSVHLVPKGELVAKRPPAMLSGECAGATHWVRELKQGAFSAELRGGPDATTPKRTFASKGDGSECEPGSESDACRTPWAVLVEPIHGN